MFVRAVVIYSFYSVSKNEHYKDEAVIKAFGKRVRELREERGLTMEQFANSITLTEVHTNQLARIERGETNVTISYIFLLAQELEIHPSDLIYFDENK